MGVENPRVERTVEVGPETQVDGITRGEVEAALKKMKRGKATGPDDIPVEAWRVLGYTGVDVLLKVLTHIFEQEKMPDERRDSILIPIFKNKGDIQECSNYCGIKLMSHTLKLWE